MIFVISCGSKNRYRTVEIHLLLFYPKIMSNNNNN
jgi:hypothetical protein